MIHAPESWLINYLINAVWQVPLVFAAAWFAALATRRAGPAFEHRLWVSAGLLEVLLPACSAEPWYVLQHWVAGLFMTPRGVSNGLRVAVAFGPGTGVGLLRLPGMILHLLVLSYVLAVVYCALRLLWRVGRTERLHREAQPLALPPAAKVDWAQTARYFSLPDAKIATGAGIKGPMALGIRRQVVLLPPGLLEELTEDDLQTLLAHEFAHLQRHDFLKNLLYEIFALPVSLHPCLWLTRMRLVESREMLCDQIAAEAVAGPHRYARSLLRLASLLTAAMPVHQTHAIGILDAQTLERRIMKLTTRNLQPAGTRRIANLALCLLFAIATCASAVGLRTRVASAESPRMQSSSDPSVPVAPGVMAGQVLSRVSPVYPQAAKDAKIEGAVLLHAVIGKEGVIQSLTVISGPPELRGSAIDAVRQWVYKPYLLNGDPTDVETTITVNYSLEK